MSTQQYTVMGASPAIENRRAVKVGRSANSNAVGRKHHAAGHRSIRRMIRTKVLMLLDWGAISTTLMLLASQTDSVLMRGSYGKWSMAIMLGAIAAGVLLMFRVYTRSWRFFGFWHAGYIAFATFCGLLFGWASIFVLSPGLRSMENGAELLPFALNHWLLAVAGMMTLRAARRLVREKMNRPLARLNGELTKSDKRLAILVGSPQWAMSVVELIRAEKEPSFIITGVLLPSISDTIDRIGNVPVLGSHDMLVDVVNNLEDRGIKPSLVIACDDGTHLSHREIARLTHRTRTLGLELSRIQDCWSHILQRPSQAGPQELSVKDLLGRNEYEMDGRLIADQVEGCSVLVTGAGGTIGGELCWQLASFKPSRLVLLEHSEYQLYAIEMRLREQYPEIDIHAEICNIRDRDAVRRVFATHRPEIVYHAAALKHVPIVEANPCAGVHTNIIGTKIVADAVCEFCARAMVQVSTDKAVNPVGMMGATKRVGELYSQALDLCGVDDPEAPRFMTVRFGNVLGSSGSIVPLFRRQLEEGKPLTVTHPDIERFFMTVREAVQLILQSSSSALTQDSQRGTIFVLDMGKPVRIVDLAYRMVTLYGLEPETDVPIEYVGLRPGEKLYEELFDNCEEQIESRIKGIFEATSLPIPLPFITRSIDQLSVVVAEGNHAEALRITHNLAKIPGSGASFEIFTGAQRGAADSKYENTTQ
ncbi:MAG: polysaccharide biosynthesis protein [Sphingomonadaceae bacterium]